MKKFIPILLLSILVSCGEEVVEKPENLIAKDQMTEIIYDLAILNAARKTNPRYLEELDIESMPFIYEKYGVDSTQFARSDLYYASVPEEYESIYKIVEARLEAEKSEFDENKTRVSDSVRKVAEEQRKALKQKSSVRKNDSLQ